MAEQARGRLRAFLGCWLLLALAACSGGNDPGQAAEGAVAQVTGSVFYRERMLLPPGAQVEVQLQDISRPDALATVVASVILEAEGGPPYPFTIDYDPARIDRRGRYALRATIARDQRLLFTTTEYVDPFGDGPLEMLVQRVPEPVARDAAAVEGTVWVLATLAGEPAPVGAGGKPIDLQLFPGEQQAGGFSGCNRYRGGYRREGSSGHGSPLAFGPLAGTLMACPEGGDLERRYLETLGRVDAFRLEGDVLTLLSGADVVATFRAQ